MPLEIGIVGLNSLHPLELFRRQVAKEPPPEERGLAVARVGTEEPDELVLLLLGERAQFRELGRIQRRHPRLPERGNLFLAQEGGAACVVALVQSRGDERPRDSVGESRSMEIRGELRRILARQPGPGFRRRRWGRRDGHGLRGGAGAAFSGGGLLHRRDDQTTGPRVEKRQHSTGDQGRDQQGGGDARTGGRSHGRGRRSSSVHGGER